MINFFLNPKDETVIKSYKTVRTLRNVETLYVRSMRILRN